MNRMLRELVRALTASILCISLLGPATAWAWGREGHRIVALIAADRLTPRARAGVAALLGPDVRGEMEAVSTWADEIRDQRPETARWHYVDIEITSPGYDAARDCPGGNCVVAQIARNERLVADTRLAKPARAEALRFLIHFVGDLHQPLHCADHHDRGGNSVRVKLGGEETNLHSVWDTAIVAGLGDDPVGVSAELNARITPHEADAWSRGGPADWANDSFAIAKRDVYGPLRGMGAMGETIRLPDDYLLRERPVVTGQLEKAGVRLAMLLNAAFSGRGAGASSVDADAEPTNSVAGNATSSVVITPEEASSHVGQIVTVRGEATDVHAAHSAGVTFIDMGGSYPNNAFTAVIFSDDAAGFPDVASLAGRTVEITGRVRLYRGKPEIVLTRAKQMAVQ